MKVWHWTCVNHGYSGVGNDGSLDRHQDEEHGGNQITVMFEVVETEDDSTSV